MTLYSFVLVSICLIHTINCFKPEEKLTHNPRALSNDEISKVALLTNEPYFRDVLGHILIPRVVGTPGHEQVKKIITSQLKTLGWDVQLDEFRAATPNFGTLEFSNIIASKPSNASRQLVLACHYDSKYFKNIKFLGATDSAVPCAMLLHLAYVLTPYIEDSKIGLTLIFFDGEEAFENWTPTDSIYGARALAARWERTPYPADSLTTNHLHRIDLFVLLDLIGVKNQKFYSFFRDTGRWHSHLAKIERKLKSMNIIPSTQPTNFLEKSTLGFIEDDHIPFTRRNVPVLHVIPREFPIEWHTVKDDYSILDFPTIDTLNKIFQVFVYSYLKGSNQGL